MEEKADIELKEIMNKTKTNKKKQNTKLKRTITDREDMEEQDEPNEENDTVSKEQTEQFTTGVKQQEQGHHFFRMTGFLGTGKGHPDKNKVAAWMQERSGTKKIKSIHICHERPDKISDLSIYKQLYNHFHMVIVWEECLNFKKSTHFDWKRGDMEICGLDEDENEIIHMNIEPIRMPFEPNWQRACEYIAKEDKECAELLKWATQQLANKKKKKVFHVLEQVKKAHSLEEALEAATDIKEFTNISVAYYAVNGKDFEPMQLAITKPSQICGWEIQFMNKNCKLRARTINDRKIHCIVDLGGGTGKTQLALYMEEIDPQHVLSITTEMRTGDVAEFLNTCKNSVGWSGGTIIVNLQRAQKYRRDLFKLLEYLKDGKMTSGKYHGSSARVNVPALFVFSNFWPCWKGSISADRISVHQIQRTIDDGKTLERLLNDIDSDDEEEEQKEEKIRSQWIKETKLTRIDIHEANRLALENKEDNFDLQEQQEKKKDDYGM
jgi:hypothetical protein